MENTTQQKEFAYYSCSCKHSWLSAMFWKNFPQKCKKCKKNVFYSKTVFLDNPGDKISVHKRHKEKNCGKCKKLGYSCTLLKRSNDFIKKRKLRKKYTKDVFEKEELILFNPYENEEMYMKQYKIYKEAQIYEKGHFYINDQLHKTCQ